MFKRGLGFGVFFVFFEDFGVFFCFFFKDFGVFFFKRFWGVFLFFLKILGVFFVVQIGGEWMRLLAEGNMQGNNHQNIESRNTK